MPAEAIVVTFRFRRRPPRALGLASLLFCVVFGLWCAADLASFVELVVRSAAMDSCLPDVERRVRVELFTNYAWWWGHAVYGVESGSFHAYGGPGAAYFRVGLGDVVLEATHPMCSSPDG